MRKLLAVILSAGALVFTVVPADAQYQRRHNHYAPRYYAPPRHVVHPPRYYAPPRHYAPQYARPRTNWVPYVVGGAVLGAVGAYFYNQYGQLCNNVVVGQGWNGYRYVPITETVCE